MEHFTLEQLRAAIASGAVLSITLEGVGDAFAVRITMRRGAAVLVATNTGRPRSFADPRRALLLLKELGIVEAKIDTRGWSTNQVQIKENA